MKQLLCLLFSISAFTVSSQIVNIPDDNFKSYLLNNISVNTNNDAEIQVSEANAFSGTLAFQFFFINDLTGIEAFTNLSILDCGDNNLTTLDLSSNLALTQLYCYDNDITALDISANIMLTALDCRDNMMTDLTLNENLTYLQCTFNQIEELDVSQNLQLSILRCFSNNISSLDLTANTALTNLYCNNNELEVLDLSNNSAITIIECSSNSLTDLYVDNSNNTSVTSFTVISNPDLDCIQVDNVAYSEANWLSIDSGTDFSLDCSSLGVEEFSYNSVEIFPNPTKNDINIKVNQNVSYKIISITGEVLKKGKLLEGTQRINVVSISSGIYFIAFETEDGFEMIKKWVKK